MSVIKFSMHLVCSVLYLLLITVIHLLPPQAKESIDQLVYLCRTDKEEVRDAAKQALLVLGNNNPHICQGDRTGRTKQW